jgi:hypothetical protein
MQGSFDEKDIKRNKLRGDILPYGEICFYSPYSSHYRPFGLRVILNGCKDYISQ